MPVRIRLSRGGAKKRPFYRIVVADSRRARDGKFIDQIGTYNPMLPKDNADRVKMDVEKAKEWIAKANINLSLQTIDEKWYSKISRRGLEILRRQPSRLGKITRRYTKSFY